METTPAVTPRAMLLLGSLDGRGLAAPSNVMGVPCQITRTETSEGERQEQAERRPGHVDVEVAELRQPTAGQAADDGHGCRNTGGRRHELQELKSNICEKYDRPVSPL